MLFNRFVLCLLVISTLLGCSQRGGSHSEFYTWVDERGQMHTQKAPSAQSKDLSGKSKGVQDIKPEEYVSSDEIDARLRDRRLFAWQDETGKQNVSEAEKVDSPPVERLGGVAAQFNQTGRTLSMDCCESIASEERYLWNDLAGREVSLLDYYRYVDALKSDALILDISRNEVSDIRIKSFIRSSKLAIPDVVLLNERFQLIALLEMPFTHYVSETWASYGYMQGRISQASLADAAYVVFVPSAQAGVLELGDDRLTLTDLGLIVVQRDAPRD